MIIFGSKFSDDEGIVLKIGKSMIDYYVIIFKFTL